jgi:Lrp/AsnC family leucine-responsive transcriptional regulator
MGVLMVDDVDELILSALSADSKQHTAEICDFLKDHGCYITEKEIESRIIKLEENGVITGYTVSMDTKKIKRRIIRVVLVTFKTSQHLRSRVEGLKKYLSDAPFVIFSGRTRGGYDWISVQAFLTEEIADEESDIYRSLFGDIIQSYSVFDFVSIKKPSLHALMHSEKEYKKFLTEWIPTFLDGR